MVAKGEGGRIYYCGATGANNGIEGATTTTATKSDTATAAAVVVNVNNSNNRKSSTLILSSPMKKVFNRKKSNNDDGIVAKYGQDALLEGEHVQTKIQAGQFKSSNNLLVGSGGDIGRRRGGGRDSGEDSNMIDGLLFAPEVERRDPPPSSQSLRISTTNVKETISSGVSSPRQAFSATPTGRGRSPTNLKQSPSKRPPLPAKKNKKQNHNGSNKQPQKQQVAAVMSTANNNVIEDCNLALDDLIHQPPSTTNKSQTHYKQSKRTSHKTATVTKMMGLSSSNDGRGNNTSGTPNVHLITGIPTSNSGKTLGGAGRSYGINGNNGNNRGTNRLVPWKKSNSFENNSILSSEQHQQQEGGNNTGGIPMLKEVQAMASVASEYTKAKQYDLALSKYQEIKQYINRTLTNHTKAKALCMTTRSQQQQQHEATISSSSNGASGIITNQSPTALTSTTTNLYKKQILSEQVERDMRFIFGDSCFVMGLIFEDAKYDISKACRCFEHSLEQYNCVRSLTEGYGSNSNGSKAQLWSAKQLWKRVSASASASSVGGGSDDNATQQKSSSNASACGSTGNGSINTTPIKKSSLLEQRLEVNLKAAMVSMRLVENYIKQKRYDLAQDCVDVACNSIHICERSLSKLYLRKRYESKFAPLKKRLAQHKVTIQTKLMDMGVGDKGSVIEMFYSQEEFGDEVTITDDENHVLCKVGSIDRRIDETLFLMPIPVFDDHEKDMIVKNNPYLAPRTASSSKDDEHRDEQQQPQNQQQQQQQRYTEEGEEQRDGNHVGTSSNDAETGGTTSGGFAAFANRFLFPKFS